jgi:hypothetical protein
VPHSCVYEEFSDEGTKFEIKQSALITPSSFGWIFTSIPAYLIEKLPNPE